MQIPEIRMNPVYRAALEKKAGVTDKYDCYYYAYDFHFSRIQGRELRLLEIGVNKGGGINLWAQYFKTGKFVGVDMDPACTRYRSEDIDIRIGDQEDGEFLRNLSEQYDGFDIIIDDGGHTMDQQRTSFKILFPLLNDGGIYVIEDLHTSYWPAFGGGLNEANSFVTYLKGLVDHLNWWPQRSKRAGEFRTDSALTWEDTTIQSVHFHDSVAFIYKGPHPEPIRMQI